MFIAAREERMAWSTFKHLQLSEVQLRRDRLSGQPRHEAVRVEEIFSER